MSLRMESSLPLVAGTAGAFRQTLQRHPMLGPLAMAAGIVVSRRWMVLLAEEMEKGQDEGDSKDTTKKEGSQSQAEDKPLSAAMVGSIGFYKNFISPLLPPACRFVPTCSQYGVQAIEEFGPSKGVILIAWRLLRCSPIGGKGYDPPKWPPVAFTYSSW